MSLRALSASSGFAAFLLAIGLAVSADAQSPSAVQSPAQTLHIRHLEDGRWIGWIDTRTQRTRVTVPQDRAEIDQFARQNGLAVEVHRESVAPLPDPLPARPEARTAFLPPERSTAVPSTSRPHSGQAAASAAANPTGDGNASEAEQVTRLENSIKADEEQMAELRRELADPESEYRKAEADFKEINAEYEKAKGDLAKLRESGKKPPAATETALNALEKKWKLARSRFDLAIDTRKTLMAQVSALEDKMRQDRQVLDKMVGGVHPKSADTKTPPADAPSPIPMGTSAAASPISKAVGAANPAAAAVLNQGRADAAGTDAKPGDAMASDDEDSEDQKELNEARQAALAKKEEAREAEEEVKSLSDRLAAVDKNIALEQKLFDAARKKASIAEEQRIALEQEYMDKTKAGAPAAELQALSKELVETGELLREARHEVDERTDRLSELQTERQNLHAEEVAALSEAKQKEEEAEKAEDVVEALQNPFSTHNMLQWLIDHGPKLALILIGMLFLRSMVHLATRRLVQLMARSGGGTHEERTDRARTLMGVFHNAASVSIVVGGLLMMCEQVGIAIGPLMGGAAVVGLAAAFGAQNLIRDYFYGFVILLENQYKINDVLKIGEFSGQVERITLRVTVLRDLEGRVHFIPNGKIDSVTNMTHGWSRAVFEIGVAYKEDVDHVMGVLMDLARELRRDPAFAPSITDDPEMLGVDALADSAVKIKFVLKTRPTKQWQVKRELLRRIKRRFDELGIEIPFPQQTVHHFFEASAATPEDLVTEQKHKRAA